MVDAVPGELAGQQQTSRPRARDEHLCIDLRVRTHNRDPSLNVLASESYLPCMVPVVSELRGLALVTGATGGLGAAIARALAGAGADLVVTGRRADVLTKLAEELDARAVVADLAHRSEVERLVEEAGAFTYVVANAGIPAGGDLAELSNERVDRALEVNLLAPVALAHRALPGLRRRGHGHLVFVSSLSGLTATAGSALYSAAKFGIRGFAFALRQDLRGTGVGVSVVTPGPIRDAGMLADAGIEIPRFLGSRPPGEVGNAVVRAIRDDVPEIIVAPRALRAGALLGALSPRVNECFNHRSGINDRAKDIVQGQRDRW